MPADMVDAVGALTASLVLEQYNAAYYPGVASFANSGGGFQQSATMRQKGPFGEQMERLQARALSYFESWRASHSGVRMASLGR